MIIKPHSVPVDSIQENSNGNITSTIRNTPKKHVAPVKHRGFSSKDIVVPDTTEKYSDGVDMYDGASAPVQRVRRHPRRHIKKRVRHHSKRRYAKIRGKVKGVKREDIFTKFAKLQKENKHLKLEVKQLKHPTKRLSLRNDHKVSKQVLQKTQISYDHVGSLHPSAAGKQELPKATQSFDPNANPGSDMQMVE